MRSAPDVGTGAAVPTRLLQHWFVTAASAPSAAPRLRWRFALDRPLDATRLSAALDALHDELDVMRCELRVDGATLRLQLREPGGQGRGASIDPFAPLHVATSGTTLLVETSRLWLDRRSALVVLAALARLYADRGALPSIAREASGPDGSVPGLLNAERRRESSAEVSRALAWWAARLPARVAELSLPSTGGGSSNARHRVREELAGADAGIDRHVRWLSALGATLYRYGNREPLLVEVPSRLDAAADAVGPFEQSLVVVLEPRGEETLAAFAQRVAAALAAARAHGTVCAEQWLALRPELRGASGRAAVPLRLEVAEAVPRVTAFGEVEATLVEERVGAERAGPALSLAVQGGSGGAPWRLTLDVDGERCTVPDAERMLGHLARVAARCGSEEADTLRLDDVVLLTAAEWRRELAWNDTAAPFAPVPPHRSFEARAARDPGRVAVECAAERLGYGELNARANRLARGLLERGAVAGDALPLLLPNSIELVVATLACAKAGLAFAPLDAAWPTARLAGVLERLDTRVIIVAEALPAGVGQRPGTLVGTVDSLASSAPDAHLDLDVRPPMGAAMYIVHTSGTTGEPKGAINTVGALVSRFSALDLLLGPARAMRGLLSAAPFFDASVSQLLWPLARGGRVVVVEEETLLDLPAMLALMERSRFTFTDFVPSYFDVLVEEMVHQPEYRRALAHRPVLLIGGEAMLERPVRRLLEWFPGYPVYNDYGPAETAVSVLFHRVHGTGDGPIPIGLPLGNTVALILDEAARPVPQGQTGELCIGGVCVGSGYVGDEVATARAFVPNPFPEIDSARLYRTGDRARRRHDGAIVFAGRADRQVKVRGVRIELADVENALRKASGSADVHVRAVGEGAARRLIGYVRASRRRGPALSAIERDLRELLPAAARPARLLSVSEWPRRRSGKLDEAALPLSAPAAGERGPDPYPDRDSEGPLERLLARWLGERPIRPERSLFEQGLSIAGLLGLCAELESLPEDVPTIEELSDEPTLAMLARRLG